MKSHSLFLNPVSNTLNDVLNHRFMISMRFIISKSHHLPAGEGRIPVNFDYSIIDLFPCRLQPETHKIGSYREWETQKKLTLPIFHQSHACHRTPRIVVSHPNRHTTRIAETQVSRANLGLLGYA